MFKARKDVVLLEVGLGEAKLPQTSFFAIFIKTFPMSPSEGAGTLSWRHLLRTASMIFVVELVSKIIRQVAIYDSIVFLKACCAFFVSLSTS